ncbi:hypothetical protein B9Z55_026580 [Caenorhabditis nigoni]|uniref:MRG domain-containing protein n=1 Tax=Caenorhabditis nigoni TaxID=1611254 RepID=A0A2G5T4A9_9PELO|nr:hypothetical protein B9Z55_026580 [Caenorhabditis nigoni]
MAMFVSREKFVCVEKGIAYEAKIRRIRTSYKGTFYIVHFQGWSERSNIRVQVGKEEGKMFKGTLQEYYEKYGVSEPQEEVKAEVENEGGDENQAVGNEEETAENEEVEEGEEDVEEEEVEEEEVEEEEVEEEEVGEEEAGEEEVEEEEVEEEDEKVEEEEETQENEVEVEVKVDEVPVPVVVPVVKPKKSRKRKHSPLNIEGAVEISGPRARRSAAKQVIEEFTMDKFVMSRRLRRIQDDDRKLRIRHHIRIKMPCRVSINEIVNDYVRTLRRFNKNQKITRAHIQKWAPSVLALVDHFNSNMKRWMYGVLEEWEYPELKEYGENPSQYYGIIHLGRCVKKLRGIYELFPNEQASIEFIMLGLGGFNKFLDKHYEKYYRRSEDYENLTEYQFENHQIVNGSYNFTYRAKDFEMKLFFFRVFIARLETFSQNHSKGFRRSPLNGNRIFETKFGFVKSRSHQLPTDNRMF